MDRSRVRHDEFLQEISQRRLVGIPTTGRDNLVDKQGRRHNFANITASEASRKFWEVVPPTYAILGIQQEQTEAYESLSDSVATISYRSCSCIYRLI